MNPKNIWIAAVDGDEAAVLRFIAQDPTAVNSLDENGYTPLHAAASYNHDSLLRKLVLEHGGNVNIQDFDGETPLFVTETVHVAKILVEELHADPNHKNNNDMTAADVIEEDGDFPLIAAYLRAAEQSNQQSSTTVSSDNVVTDLPEPPKNVSVRLETVEDGSAELPLVDDNLRQRIEELASRENFSSAEVQLELRNLVKDAVHRHVADSDESRLVRPRTEGS